MTHKYKVGETVIVKDMKQEVTIIELINNDTAGSPWYRVKGTSPPLSLIIAENKLKALIKAERKAKK